MNLSFTRLKRVASLQAGGTPAVADNRYWAFDGDGTPWVAITDMSDGSAVQSTSRELTQAGVESKNLRPAPPGTVLFAMYGSVGAIAELGVSACWNQALLGITAEPSLADQRFVRYWLEHLRPSLLRLVRSNTQDNLNAEQVGNFPFPTMPVWQQRRIAAFLDAETSRLDELVAVRSRTVELLNERIDSQILAFVAASPLGGGSDFGSSPIKRQLEKQERWASEGEMVTAFRDGQVTSRAERGRDGFTDAWTDGARVQIVEVGDVVVHGLDGFSGAIGDAEVSGVCSPVNHVCSAPSGDATFLARLLRLLAVHGYLGNFATSTRERAVDFRNWDLFGRIPMPLVPVEEQIRIGSQIRSVRPLENLVARSQEVAQERRRALIAAAVTGEMEVP